jgi:GGDEF domain-containing protein
MDHALTNWSKVHKLLKGGKLPPEVVMHAVMFAQLSPNKPVPTQEIQYARLVDAMDATGIDPRHPNFHEIEQPWKNMDQPDELPWTGREAFRNNPAYYQGGQIGVKRDGEGNKEGKPSMETGRYPGELLSISPLASDFLGRAAQYHKLHDGLVGLVNTHRHDGLSAVNELMNQKTKATNYQNVRRAAIKAGKPDPGPYQGVTVPGLKVKTGLYTWGMMGNGNSVVPDTHFIRNMYGLDLEKDQHTIEYLKNLHWRTTNMPLMKGYNDWYAKNHPAVEYTVNHPKWGSVFEKREDALFPAFWRHWLTIAPHERALGMPNRSEQAGTTHAPYWEAIAPHIDPLLKGEESAHDSSVPLRTALVHQQYAKDYGEVPAMMMYYRFLVPKLLEAAEHRERVGKDMQFLAKTRLIENQVVELRKSVREALEGKAVPAPRVHTVEMRINGKLHPAGRYMVHDGNIHHLEDYHGILGSMVPEGPMDAATISRLHGLEFAPHIAVAQHEPEEAPGPVAQEHVIADDPLPPRPPVFEYHRPGMSRPHVVEFGPGGAALDGKALDHHELQLMLDNVSGGVATLRYRSNEPETLAKAGDGGFFSRLRTRAADFAQGLANKIRPPEDEGASTNMEDFDPGDALQHVRAAVASGHIHPDVERALTRHIYEDKMAPGIGNKYAWDRFQERPRPGVMISMDGNDIKSINDTHGHAAGDTAIRGLAGALRSASDKVGTGKLFRSGGDEFTAHFPTYEDAAAFVRHARNHIDKVPPINGTHKLSMTFGLGNDFAGADKALYIAKEGKHDSKFPGQKIRAYAPGRVPHLGHSLVAGAEGPLQMHTEQPPAAALVKPTAAAPAPTRAPA